MLELDVSALRQRIQPAERILIASHIRPDGDAIGSLLGLGLALQNYGKQIEMVLADGVPANYLFLPGAEQIVESPQGDFDMIISLDCSDLKRLGRILDGYSIPDINIDHHITNANFGRMNLVQPQAVATAEILANLLPRIGIPITQPAAVGLLTGIVTDTLGFRTANMTPDALRAAADLLEFGVDLPAIFQNTLIQRSFEAISYWSAGLGKIQREDGLVWTSLSLADRKAAHYPGRDDADLINVLSSIANIDIAVILVEQGRNKVKVSWRARPGLDVSRAALGFGGGGHPAAAGAEVPGTLTEVEGRVIQVTKELIAESLLVN